MRDLVPYLRLLLQQRWRLAAGTLLLLVTVLAAIGLLALSGWFITATAVTAMLWAAGIRVMFDIYTPGGGIRFFALTRTVARYFERLYNHDTVLRLLADLRSGIFAALTRLPPLKLARLRTASLLNRLTADIDALDNLYLRLLAPPLVALLASFMIAAVLALFIPPAGLLALPVLLGLLGLVTVVAARHGHAVSERLPDQTETLRVRMIEQFQGLAELLAYNTLAQHRRWLIRDEAALMAGQRWLDYRSAGWQALVTLILQLLAVGVLAVTIMSYQAGHISAAVAVLAPLAVMGLSEAFTPLPGAFARFGSSLAAARRLTATASQQPGAANAAPLAHSHSLPASAGVVLTGARLHYPLAERAVLDGVDLHVAAGEHIIITGSSGCGKSTLADVLAGVRCLDSGQLLLGGIAIRNIDDSELQRGRAYQTQRTDLFADTLAGNLRIAAPAADNAALRRVLDSVELGEWSDALPEGTDTWIGEAGRQLSGGQARRLALARLLLRDPAVVILDEPLAGVDHATGRRVLANLNSWLRGRTCIAFGHDADMLPAADRQLRFEDGGKLSPLA